MSHSFAAREGGTVFLYNSDMSGNVRIIVNGGKEDERHVDVPAQDLLEFVAEVVRSEKISILESMEFRQVLGLTVG